MSFVPDNSVVRSAFVASAPEARRDVARNGRVMAAADVHKWLLRRAGGGSPPSCEEAGYDSSSSVAIAGGALVKRIRKCLKMPVPIDSIP